MGTKIILPWDVNTELPEIVWARGSLSTRPFFKLAHTKLPKKKLEQVKAISTAVVTDNYWVACLSASPYYMRTLYPVIAATWVYSRRDTADIMDSEDLLKGVFATDSKDKEIFRDIILGTGLLIIPHIDSNQIGIKKARGTLSTLLMQRKMQKRPTIVDIKVSAKPNDGIQVNKELEYIQDILGESSTALFKSDGSKIFLVSIKE